jgi:hypothetical protein
MMMLANDSMIGLPKRGRNARNLALVFGIALFLWTRIEDNSVLPVVLFGVGLSALVTNLWLLDKFGGKAIALKYAVPGAVVIGTVIGLGAAVAAALLMFFKTALHAHVFPDYPPAQIIAMLERAPAWSAAGGLIGLGLALVWLAVRSGEKPKRIETIE